MIEYYGLSHFIINILNDTRLLIADGMFNSQHKCMIGLIIVVIMIVKQIWNKSHIKQSLVMI